MGAIKEVLKEEAIITDKYNQTQTKVALTKLIEDINFRKELGEKAVEFARRNFSWENTAQQFLSNYELAKKDK